MTTLQFPPQSLQNRPQQPQANVHEISPLNDIQSLRDVASEAAIVNHLLFYNDSITLVLNVKPEAFTHADYRLAFRSMLSIWENYELNFEVPILIEEAKRLLSARGLEGNKLDKQLERFTESLSDIFKMNVGEGISNYADIVMNYYVKRQLYQQALQTIKVSMSSDILADEACSQSIQQVFRIQEDLKARKSVPKNMPSVIQVIEQELIDDYKAFQDGTLIYKGLPSPSVQLNEMVHGDVDRGIVALGGVSHSGKSTLAISWALYAAKVGGKTIVFYSLEEPADNFVRRVIAMNSHIDVSTLSRPRTHEEVSFALSNIQQFKDDYVMSFPSGGKLIVDDTKGLTPTELKTRTLYASSLYGDIDGVFVDTFNRMNNDGVFIRDEKQRYANNVFALENLSGRNDLNLPIIFTAQIKKEVVDKIKSPPYQLGYGVNFTDFGGAAEIGNTAYISIIVEKPASYNNPDYTEFVNDMYPGRERISLLHISKARDGYAELTKGKPIVCTVHPQSKFFYDDVLTLHEEIAELRYNNGNSKPYERQLEYLQENGFYIPNHDFSQTYHAPQPQPQYEQREADYGSAI